MPIFIPLMCLLGMGVARFRGYAQVVSAGPAVRDDVPVRLLRWAVGLLSAQREEWGQAMLGELGHIEGRGRRWRFAAGCAGAALLLAPWGRAAAAVWAMTVVAAGAAACTPPRSSGTGWVPVTACSQRSCWSSWSAMPSWPACCSASPVSPFPGCWAACSSP